MPSNAQRIRRAEKALRAGYSSASTGNEEDFQDAIVDLLADLQHLAAAKDLPWSDLLDTATRHFNLEH